MKLSRVSWRNGGAKFNSGVAVASTNGQSFDLVNKNILTCSAEQSRRLKEHDENIHPEEVKSKEHTRWLILRKDGRGRSLGLVT